MKVWRFSEGLLKTMKSKLESGRNEDRKEPVVRGEQEASACLGPWWSQRTDVLRGTWIKNTRRQVMDQEQDFLNLWPENWPCLRNWHILGVTSDVGVEMEWRNASLEIRCTQSQGLPGLGGCACVPSANVSGTPAIYMSTPVLGPWDKGMNRTKTGPCPHGT